MMGTTSGTARTSASRRYASQPAPSTIVRVRGGVSTPISLTLQGIILDDGSAASVPASVTNGAVLVIE